MYNEDYMLDMIEEKLERGASPVVGVVVLVAIVVILSSLTFATVTHFTGTTQNAQAGVSVDYQSESAIDVQLNNKQTADKVIIQSAFGTEYTLTEPGDSVQLLNADTNTTPTAIGVLDGERTVLQRIPPHSFEPDLVVGDDDEDYATISNAVSDANSGDIIVVEKASYDTTGVTVPNGITLVAETGTNITDTSGSGGSTITLEGNASVANVEVNAGDEAHGVSTSSTNASVVGVSVTDASSEPVSAPAGVVSSDDELVPSTSISTSSDDSGSSGSSEVSESHSAAPSDLQAVLNNMSGEGTASNPYMITDDHELQAMNADTTANYALANDINASLTSEWNSGKGFDPINSFSGSLDGNSYEIHNFTIDRPSEQGVGLFSKLDGTVTDIGVEGDVTSEQYVGGIAGTTSSNSEISNSYANVTVISTHDGFGNSEAGGLVGTNKGTITNSYALGDVSGQKSIVGGLVGEHQGDMSNVYASGEVSGGDRVGGLVGNYIYASASDSYWDTESTGQSSAFGYTVSTSTSNINGLTTSEMTGDAAQTNMNSLDFNSVWVTVEGDYPELQSDSE